jgi:hypothetical protein
VVSTLFFRSLARALSAAPITRNGSPFCVNASPTAGTFQTSRQSSLAYAQLPTPSPCSEAGWSGNASRPTRASSHRGEGRASARPRSRPQRAPWPAIRARWLDRCQRFKRRRGLPDVPAGSLPRWTARISTSAHPACRDRSAQASRSTFPEPSSPTPSASTTRDRSLFAAAARHRMRHFTLHDHTRSLALRRILAYRTALARSGILQF